ncbi:DUF459 domain-containing protein [Neotabrizicola sp. VNH66]|uniref:DUF459 domain-containing protein n=1 Tax=Neotabrizicola sp. VNH66 TaxID=3400918 RepID=UPI003C0925F8
MTFLSRICPAGRALGLVLPLCLAAFPLSAAPLYCPETPARVAVLGDSLADGVWASLFRSWQKCDTVSLYRVTHVSDGLTVTSPEKWSERLADSLGANTPADFVVIQFGANDIRPVRTTEGRAVFGTPEWQAAYGARVTELLSLLHAQAGAAFWLGLPVVGDTDLEPSYVDVSAIQAAVAGDAAAPMPTTFVDLHAATMFGTEGFVQSLEIDGHMTQLRAGDLIHFTEKGYDMVAATFTPDLEARLKARDADAALNALALQ